jgi:hypothetical protein
LVLCSFFDRAGRAAAILPALLVGFGISKLGRIVDGREEPKLVHPFVGPNKSREKSPVKIERSMHIIPPAGLTLASEAS